MLEARLVLRARKAHLQTMRVVIVCRPDRTRCEFVADLTTRLGRACSVATLGLGAADSLDAASRSLTGEDLVIAVRPGSGQALWFAEAERRCRAPRPGQPWILTVDEEDDPPTLDDIMRFFGRQPGSRSSGVEVPAGDPGRPLAGTISLAEPGPAPGTIRVAGNLLGTHYADVPALAVRMGGNCWIKEPFPLLQDEFDTIVHEGGTARAVDVVLVALQDGGERARAWLDRGNATGHYPGCSLGDFAARELDARAVILDR